jgi:predicted DNA-binding antitoxin AbrB/MazE fold protein
MNAVHAIYEKGVFRPIDPVDLPEKAHVVFEPRVVSFDAAPTAAMALVYEVLSRSYETNTTDLAERHDEHQP